MIVRGRGLAHAQHEFLKLSWWAGGMEIAGSRAMPRSWILRGGEFAAVRLSSRHPRWKAVRRGMDICAGDQP